MATELLLSTQATNTQKISCCFWDYNNGNILQVYKNGGGSLEKSLNVLGNDYILTAETTKPLLHLWPINSQEPVKNTRLIIPEPATVLQVCPNSRFAAVGIGTKLYLWELSTGKLLSVQSMHYQAISCINFSSGSEFVLAAGRDGMLVCYQLMDLIVSCNTSKVQSELGQVEPVYKKMDHSLSITGLYVGKFGLKSRFTTVSLDQTAKIYNLLDGLLLLTLIFDSSLTAITQDISSLYVGEKTGKISKVSLQDPPRTLEHHIADEQRNNFLGHTAKITALDLNIFNNRLASASEDCNILVWCTNSFQVLKKIELKSAVTNLQFVLTAAHYFGQDFKPKVVVSSFERSVESDPLKSCVSWTQNIDYNLFKKYAECAEESDERIAMETLQQQVLQLKKVTNELLLAKN